MTDIEIPYAKDRNWQYRFWEIFPGAVSWTILITPFVLSFVAPQLMAILVIAYLLIWFFKGIALSIRVLQGWNSMQTQMKLDWPLLLADLQATALTEPGRKLPKWHTRNIGRIGEYPLYCQPDEVKHALIVTLYNEPRDVLEPTIKSILASEFDMKKVILIIAFEERTGPDIEKLAHDMVKEYGSAFYHAEAVKHTVLEGEVRGKGGNITWSGRWLKEYVTKHKLDPSRIVVTTLDTDNRPHKHYLSALTYTYCSTEDTRHVSYQPIPMFLNNIWDAPSPMRVIAAGNSMWNLMLSNRPHALRNFSSHAQGLHALIDTDFWSVRTIVEDGHQFWRTYFRYDGRHEVYPIFLPIYQDAVLAASLRRTLKVQFLQIRRWAYGASDVAYVATRGFRKGSKVPKIDMIAKFWRLLEGHISWATAALLISFASLIPILLKPRDFAANQLPHIASTIQTIALIGIFVSLFVTLKSLPPKPERYKRHRTVFMVVQWVLLPITTIVYQTLAGLNSQTHLMLGKYLDNFDVTEKVVKK